MKVIDRKKLNNQFTSYHINECKNYKIPCPFALVIWVQLPCMGTQEQCDKWIARIKSEVPELWDKGMRDKEEWMVQINRLAMLEASK